ncbi:histidine phosphatase family protein [Companilactobacillus sp. HBUAS56257]|uniref:histidine phosphatase family protein n=1 Tax=Companilactobacillus sp. HBUAS56257 TaxID=3109360 RepID=UPI002FF2DB98
MQKTLYLMRHGQTLFNVLEKIQGWCDSPLTPKGIEQAKRAGEYFKKNQIHFDAAFCSTAERSSDTLELVTDMPYTRLKGLREMSFGKFEGEHEYLNPKITDFNKQYGDFFVQYGGESAQQNKDRVRKTITDIMNQDNQTVLIVSHAGSIMNFTGQFTDIEKIKDSGFGNCSILKFTYDDDQFHFQDIVNFKD